MAWDFALLAKPQVSLPHGMDTDRRHGTVSRMSHMWLYVASSGPLGQQSEHPE